MRKRQPGDGLVGVSISILGLCSILGMSGVPFVGEIAVPLYILAGIAMRFGFFGANLTMAMLLLLTGIMIPVLVLFLGALAWLVLVFGGAWIILGVLKALGVW